MLVEGVIIVINYPVEKRVFCECLYSSDFVAGCQVLISASKSAAYRKATKFKSYSVNHDDNQCHILSANDNAMLPTGAP